MLSKLKVVQFRNYNYCEFNFFPKLNIFMGSNGQGKTNILEAVYYLSLLRSFRTNKILYLRQWKKDSFYITGDYEEKDGLWFNKNFNLHVVQLHDRYKRIFAKSQRYFYLEIPFWADDKNETWKKMINDKILEITNIK